MAGQARLTLPASLQSMSQGTLCSVGRLYLEPGVQFELFSWSEWCSLLCVFCPRLWPPVPEGITSSETGSNPRPSRYCWASGSSETPRELHEGDLLVLFFLWAGLKLSTLPGLCCVACAALASGRGPR